MSNINAVGGNSPVQKIIANPVQRSVQTEAAQQPTPLADRVEISGVGAMLKTLKAGGAFRADKVADIKAQIEAGTYEDDTKLDAAADKLLDDLMK
jgi:anti-sigma28 factor (negative regulator of flagellin synthesis)